MHDGRSSRVAVVEARLGSDRLFLDSLFRLFLFVDLFDSNDTKSICVATVGGK